MKIRHQYFKKAGQKRASVELLTLDQTVRLAKKLMLSPRGLLSTILQQPPQLPISRHVREGDFPGYHVFFHEEKD